MAKTPVVRPAKPPKQEQVNLLLSPELLKFVDDLAQRAAPPGVVFSRQDAIRATLAKLQVQMTKPAKPSRATA